MLAGGKQNQKKKTNWNELPAKGLRSCKAAQFARHCDFIKLATCKHAALSRDSDAGSDHYLSPRCPTKHLQGTARPRNKQNTKDNGADEYSEGSYPLMVEKK